MSKPLTTKAPCPKCSAIVEPAIGRDDLFFDPDHRVFRMVQDLAAGSAVYSPYPNGRVLHVCKKTAGKTKPKKRQKKKEAAINASQPNADNADAGRDPEGADQ
jgi:hypothetical protein